MFRTPWWSIFLATAFIQFVGSLLYLVIQAEPSVIQMVYAGTKMTMLAVPATLLYLGFPLLKPSFKPKSLSAIGLGLASGALMAGSMFITYWVFSDVFTPYAPAMLAQLNKSGLSGYYWTFALGISLAHSLFEEYYWRWYMVRGLETRLSPLLATILGNFFFALHHYVILMQFFPMAIVLVLGSLVGIGGCIWSVLYKRTGSLLTTWISHILVDLAIFVIGYWLMF